MSVNTDHTQGCTGKKRYWFFRRAERAASAMAEREREPFHAYHCKRCNWFHVGSHFRAQPASNNGAEYRGDHE